MPNIQPVNRAAIRTVAVFFIIAVSLPAAAAAQGDENSQSAQPESSADARTSGSLRINADVAENADGTDADEGRAKKTDRKETKEKERATDKTTDGGSDSGLYILRSKRSVNAGGGGPLIQLQPHAEREAGQSRRENYIGVFTEPLPEPLAAQLSGLLPAGQGLLVTGVMPGSPAEKAGLKKYDVLATYDDQKLINSQQLRQLIVGDKTGRTVKLGVVRQAQLQSLEVALAERAIRFLPAAGSGRIIKLPERLELQDGKGIHGIFLRREALQLPAGRIRFSPPADQKAGEAGSQQAEPDVRRRSIVITSKDGRRYQVEVSVTDDRNKTTTTTLTGTIEEIRKQLEKLPSAIREDVGESLDRIGGVKKQGGSVRFQIQPGIEGTRPRLQLRLQRPGENGALRILELNLDRDENVDDLLKIDVLAQELKQLAPEVRRRVTATLRNTHLPGARINVQQSQ